MGKGFFLSKKYKDKKFRQTPSLSRSVSIGLLFMMLLFVAACNRSPKLNQPLSKSYLLSHLSTKEKIDLLGGVVMSTKPIPRLGIPSLRMNDGPVGVRWGHASAFPAGVALASTWDTAIVRKIGQGIGREVRAKGRNIILGPNVNITRNPLNGRAFEAFGEDPFLTSQMGVSYIIGVQDEGVGATVKHFVANNQEFKRYFINEKISERTLREIYFPAFKAAVQKARVVAVMTAYNQVNGVFCGSSHALLNTVLRNDWGFKGLIMSDWHSLHSTFPTVNNALDLEMPTGKYLNPIILLPALQSGKVKISTINAKVNNILTAEFRLHVLPEMKFPQRLTDSLLNTHASKTAALQAANEAIVLLKNNNHLLPIKITKGMRIAIIGPNAAHARAVGGGSAEVHPIFVVSPLEALQEALKGKATLQYAPGILFQYPQPVPPADFYQPNGIKQGLQADFYPNDNFSGQAVIKIVAQIDYRQGAAQETPVGLNAAFKGKFTVRWTGKIKAPVSGKYTFFLRSGSPVDLFLNNKKVISLQNNKQMQFIKKSAIYQITLKSNQLYDIKVEYHGQPYNPDKGISLLLQLNWQLPQTASIQHAVSVAAHSDMALIFAGTSSHFESEGFDRKDLRLPDNQDELIRRVASVNKHTVVILSTGAPVVVNRWISQVPALLETWFDGEYIGTAITNILLGKVNPSGKLPVTFPVSWKQEPLSIQNYRDNDSTDTYSEGLYVGYRHFDKEQIKPQFPFGFGLSYTSFNYGNLKITTDTTGGKFSADVSFTITNTGKREGAEIAQVYVHEENPQLERPVKELKGFARVELKPGASKIVHVKLDRNAFHYYNPVKNAWVIDPATFNILVGASSRNILLSGSIKWEKENFK